MKVHPLTGRKCLFVSRHSFGLDQQVAGMTPSESKSIIGDLLVSAAEGDGGARTFEHQWSVGDIVVWDNRCIAHRARPYDYAQTRTVRGTRIGGSGHATLYT